MARPNLGNEDNPPRSGSRALGLVPCLLAGLLWGGCARDNTARFPANPVTTSHSDGSSPRYQLREERHWWIELPGGAPFDASGLCLGPAGELLVVADQGPPIYRIEIPEQGDTVRLTPFACDPATVEQPWGPLARPGRLDCEGIAADEPGRLYLCEESRRLVLRITPGTNTIEPMSLDWSSVAKRFSQTDRNASFEGIAVGGGRLYLANERSPPLILAFDLESGQLLTSWVAEPAERGLGPLHYSDLSWGEGRLYVLLRHQRTILEWDPRQHAAVAQYDFGAIENEPELRYHRRYPTGVMEGLAVDADCFWLVSDNNGESRVAVRGDRRPVLVRIPRPGAVLPAFP